MENIDLSLRAWRERPGKLDKRIRELVKLRYFIVNNPSTTGELSVFQGAAELIKLDLTSTKVSGDLACLENLTKLSELRLSRTTVFGDLSGLSKATRLTWLDLGDTQVSGDLRQIEKATELMWLDLGFTKVMGNLAALQKTRRLWRLNLASTEVLGDFSSLESASELTFLLLPNTRVAGGLSGLRKATALTRLSLSNTGVSGNLSNLDKASNLIFLHLAYTKVMGDVSGLRNNQKLETLDLSNSHISGNIDAILQWPNIRSIDFSYTSVIGSITPAFHGCCAELQSLKLVNTRARFIPAHDYVAFTGFPKLTFLDLTNSPLEQGANRLFKLLRRCGSLATIKASGCGLTGSISLSLRLALGGGPLWQVLVVLELADNQIRVVEELPQHCQTLVLAGNPKIRFAKRVLRKALADGVFLDLRNATFAKQSETCSQYDQHLFGLKFLHSGDP